jgi:hypothetical protein
VKHKYKRYHPGLVSDRRIHNERERFIETNFESKSEYESYLDELRRDPVSEFLAEASDRMNDRRGVRTIGNEYFQSVYAYLRKHPPETIVETGVRDGWSTLYILSALHQNDQGTLYSIDYPIRNGEEVERYRNEAPSYESVTPTIPGGTDPGWIIPETLKDRWELRIGKSQDEMPRLYPEIEEIDVFIHDSDHSLPCMIFEYELAWEWLGAHGTIFSDDIDWNAGFDEFVNSKGCAADRICESFGYIRKDSEE